jgi:hypothetical protein
VIFYTRLAPGQGVGRGAETDGPRVASHGRETEARASHFAHDVWHCVLLLGATHTLCGDHGSPAGTGGGSGTPRDSQCMSYPGQGTAECGPIPGRTRACRCPCEARPPRCAGISN